VRQRSQGGHDRPLHNGALSEQTSRECSASDSSDIWSDAVRVLTNVRHRHVTWNCKLSSVSKSVGPGGPHQPHWSRGGTLFPTLGLFFACAFI